MTVQQTETFERQAKKLVKKYRSLVNELIQLRQNLERDPFQGTPLGKDCYKIRLAIASKGAGKSGGGRVITCVKIVHDTVYLIALYDKAEKENLADKELDELLKSAGLL
ncbi:MAG TPA: type II toxin-antitoxin system RelE/ParE family toxin [Saprospiraceae bacterium]|nr:type II toxin-antitoxin system RelE/ParE family toxin [Saprospiraceae bacterium]